MAKKESPIEKSFKFTYEYIKEMEVEYKKITDYQKQISERQALYSERQKLINEMLKEYNNLSDDTKKILDELLETQKKERIEIKNQVRELEEKNKRLQKTKELYNAITLNVQKLWAYLNENDKIIRQTTLNLGLSGVKAEMMRSSFEKSALYAAKLGGGLEDVQTVMTGFADETGRAVVLSNEMVKNVLAIGRGTGLGVEQATKLAAQFEYMGFDVLNTMKLVQGVVDTSERMGVNTTKVLKTISDNFKKLSTFTFQGGVKAFGQMAADAEKTRVSMATALNVAEATRGLEQVIELGANLQVMGGEFAKLDPFEWLYTVRNEPDKLIEKISEMTKGIYSFKKNSEGVFEKVISPADRDRLAQVAKSLGIAQEEMFEIAQRRLDIETMEKALAGKGLTKKEKELIEGAAKFNAERGRFEVMLGGTMRDISTLTKEQANAFVKEQKLLEERAKQAQTFDEAFKATINEFKSIFLPMLRGVKIVIDGVRPIAEAFMKSIDWLSKTKTGEWILKGGGFIMAGGFLLMKAFTFFGGIVKTIINLPAILSSLSVKFKEYLASFKLIKEAEETGGGIGSKLTRRNVRLKESFGAGLGAGLGVGLGAIGTGVGISIAAKGISQLADSLAKLRPEQAKTLETIGTTLAISFPAAAIGLAIFGKAGLTAIPVLLTIGATMVGVGFGIKLATTGISKMALSLAELNKSGGGAGKQLLEVAAGVGAITMAMGVGGIPALFAFNNSLARMSRNAESIEKVAKSLITIKTALTGSEEDFTAISKALTSIEKVNIRGGGALTELANLLKQPLKVEFADKQVAMVSNITLTIDKEVFTEKTIKYDALIEHTDRIKRGLRGA